MQGFYYLRINVLNLLLDVIEVRMSVRKPAVRHLFKTFLATLYDGWEETTMHGSFRERKIKLDKLTLDHPAISTIPLLSLRFLNL